ncbi:MAG TPA: hypothetical protein VJR30_23645 [Bradyrhizobium sp.]|nr:hypothetical protein [Bradyrhizobium sp.]
MFARKGLVSHLGRTAMIAGVAATVLTAVPPSLAVAAPATKERGLTAATGTSGATDFSAQRRYYRGGYYRGGGAAAAAAFAGIVGTGIAIAAANSRPGYYYDDGYYGYYGPPVAYYPAPGYYSGYRYGSSFGGQPYYGGPYSYGW